MTKRREFIKTGVLGTAGLAIGGLGFSARSYSSIIGANEKINLAVIGLRGRGGDHINSWLSLKENRNVYLKTICDVDEQFFAGHSKTILEKSGVKPVTEWDMQKVFADKEIHAVSIATPNHWHALATIWACQAGKHVFVEKPASHNLFEGRKMIEASRKYNVRVQTGTQNRSIPNVLAAMKFLHDGGIGEVFMAKGNCYNHVIHLGSQKTAPLLPLFTMTVGWDRPLIVLTMKNGCTITGTGSGIRETEIQATRVLISST